MSLLELARSISEHNDKNDVNDRSPTNVVNVVNVVTGPDAPDLVADARRIFAGNLADEPDYLLALRDAYVSGATDLLPEFMALARSLHLKSRLHKGVLTARNADEGRVVMAAIKSPRSSTRGDKSDQSDKRPAAKFADVAYVPALGCAPACAWHGGPTCRRKPGAPLTHPGHDWRAARCWTCGASPIGSFTDGSPRCDRGVQPSSAGILGNPPQAPYTRIAVPALFLKGHFT